MADTVVPSKYGAIEKTGWKMIGYAGRVQPLDGARNEQAPAAVHSSTSAFAAAQAVSTVVTHVFGEPAVKVQAPAAAQVSASAFAASHAATTVVVQEALGAQLGSRDLRPKGPSTSVNR
jgi:hypothetical protein